MSQQYFSKPLLLPSNGFEYDKICFINPPTFEFILFNDDPFFADSELEKQISFIKKYTSADPLQLYTFDFYYILANYHMYLYEGANYEKPVRCLNCGTVHRLEVDLKTLPSLKILSSKAQRELHLQAKDALITYRRRKIMDNLEYSQSVIDDVEFDTMEKKLAKFLIPQINNIHFQGKNYNQPEDIARYLQYQNRRFLHELYEKFTEKDFGLDDRVMYSCKKCKFKNFTALYDDVEMSAYLPSQHSDQGSAVFFKQLINANRMRFIPYGEYKQLPLSYFKVVSDTINEMGFDHITAGRG